MVWPSDWGGEAAAGRNDGEEDEEEEEEPVLTIAWNQQGSLHADTR
jgi:hypothetical protein